MASIRLTALMQIQNLFGSGAENSPIISQRNMSAPSLLFLYGNIKNG
jgi:hypothetical protein